MRWEADDFPGLFVIAGAGQGEAYGDKWIRRSNVVGYASLFVVVAALMVPSETDGSLMPAKRETGKEQ